MARKIHAAGLYLIGRVVTFQDPVLSERRPGLALHNPDGSVWHTRGGLGWLNPYDRRVWHYDVAVAEAAARAGFDEIQFDYVRFPSDGDVSSIRYPVRTARRRRRGRSRGSCALPRGLSSKLGARVSVDVFGLAATRDLGIGQKPRRLAKYVDAVYPMVYPSHFNSGEYGLPDPDANPGRTVTDALPLLRGRAERDEGAAGALAPGLLAGADVYGGRPARAGRRRAIARHAAGSCSGTRSGSTPTDALSGP